jgi:hypothetical protein
MVVSRRPIGPSGSAAPVIATSQASVGPCLFRPAAVEVLAHSDGTLWLADLDATHG